MKTNELTGAALDWAVAKCEGRKETDFGWWWDEFKPTTNWAHCGPIIEREGIEICPVGNGEWRAQLFCQNDLHRHYGPTPLITAMRCYVASKLEGEIEIPDGLCNG